LVLDLLADLLDGESERPSTPVLFPDAEAHLFYRPPWDLREPGAAAYRDTRFLIAGAPRKVLCRLVRARGAAVPRDELKAAAGDPAMMNPTLSGHVSDLRQALRAGLASRIDLPADPIPRADRGDAGGYRLALW
jgi:hypothetical protein